MTGGGPHSLKAGQWTDDTAMALALADHLTADVRTRREERADLMARWCNWVEFGVYSCTGTCFDIGARTAAALKSWIDRGQVLSPTASRPYAEGNGAVMRVAPVALRWLRDEEMCASAAHGQAMLTHGRIAAGAAVVVAEAARRLLLGAEPTSAGLMRWLFDEHSPTLAASYVRQTGARDPRDLSPDEVESGGHSLDTTEAALWCLLRSDSPEQAIVMAVGLGYDSDTTAAVTGALAGAAWGAAALPSRWTERVAWREQLEKTADRLLEAAETRN